MKMEVFLTWPWIRCLILFVLFCLVHTALADLRLKRWLFAVNPSIERYYRLFFSFFAAISLSAWYITLPSASRVFWEWTAAWLVLDLALLTWIGYQALRALRALDTLHFLGFKQMRGASELSAVSKTLVQHGWYGVVRHPLYLLAILLLLLLPKMTDSLLVLIFLFTGYFYLGSFPEEQKLCELFPDQWTTYKKRVPRMIPLSTLTKFFRELKRFRE